MTKLYGVINGGYQCNMERTDELNTRINYRSCTTNTLPATYDVRPISTKFDLMPITDRQPVSNVPVQKQQVFNTEQSFYPGTQQGPWSGMVSNVNLESELRNQTIALQNNPIATYVPSSNSDLYMNEPIGRIEIQTHPLLFDTKIDMAHNPNKFNLGNNMFQNSTRTDLKNVRC